MANNQQLAEWLANSAKYRTVVSNTTSREIAEIAPRLARVWGY